MHLSPEGKTHFKPSVLQFKSFRRKDPFQETELTSLQHCCHRSQWVSGNEKSHFHLLQATSDLVGCYTIHGPPALAGRAEPGSPEPEVCFPSESALSAHRPPGPLRPGSPALCRCPAYHSPACRKNPSCSGALPPLLQKLFWSVVVLVC